MLQWQNKFVWESLESDVKKKILPKNFVKYFTDLG